MQTDNGDTHMTGALDVYYFLNMKGLSACQLRVLRVLVCCHYGRFLFCVRKDIFNAWHPRGDCSARIDPMEKFLHAMS